MPLARNTAGVIEEMAGSCVQDLGDVPPVYRIDLSLPPSERYIRLAEIYRKRLWSLTGLFDEVAASIMPGVSLMWIKRFARLLLRRLYTKEETNEIKGISRVTGIELYLLVALNVLLDSFMGCTSGAAMSKQRNEEQARMLHFRTLDWGMDGLRKLIVQLDFVQGSEPEKVLATSITYVGFVGVLTGVRQNLSLSLNFRPNHDMSTFAANYRFYGSHLLVLLGLRQSISSVLRQYIVSPEPRKGLLHRLFSREASRAKHGPSTSLQEISSALPRIPTTAAYLIFCDGKESLILEKDYRSAVASTSSSFNVATNSDQDESASYNQSREEDQNSNVGVVAENAMTMAELIADSNDRRARMEACWNQKIQHTKKRASAQSSNVNLRRNPSRRARPPTDYNENTNGRNASTSALDTAQSLSGPGSNGDATHTTDRADVTATLSELVRWSTTYPITNEMTHFTAIMDPSEGRIAWIKRYVRPLEFD